MKICYSHLYSRNTMILGISYQLFATLLVGLHDLTSVYNCYVTATHIMQLGKDSIISDQPKL